MTVPQYLAFEINLARPQHQRLQSAQVAITLRFNARSARESRESHVEFQESPPSLSGLPAGFVIQVSETAEES
ncbi:hypothetical protein GJ744_000711 [Endocarpon pusillum]|uniref:Uncharacterized protein n=1 Tax=Endocarpon pusillum TaxID=364733 RepID=A0A8H7ADK6_9EURO|nr:hypothetical protein GJ744_000711 [Endocarpon pusillum]